MSLKAYWTGKHSARCAEEGAKDKACRCGGHNAKNYKSNKHHRSTARKLEIRKAMAKEEAR